MLVNGVHLLPDLSGALFWPAQRLLAVADLHFEKGSAGAAQGRMLPPYDTRATLARLAGLIRQRQPRTVVCLGDSFHDRAAGERLAPQDAESLRKLTRGRDWVWIAGNHDPAPPPDLGGRAAGELALGALTFRHQPCPEAAPGEIAGHLHPKAAVVVGGRKLVRPCFVVDGRRLVMPAFGAYAGGLDVLDPAFQPLFRRGFQALLLGQDRIHALPRHRLAGDGWRRADGPGGEPAAAGRRLGLFPSD